MTKAKINFAPNQESGSDELGGASPIAVNVVMDNKGTVRRRPAIAAFGDHELGGAVRGLYVDLQGNIFAYVDEDEGGQNRVYRVSSDGSSASDVSADLELTGTLRPTFAETEAMTLIADGTNLLKWTHATSLLEHLGGDPPRCSHVIANNSRLLVNNLELVLGQVNYSAISIGTATGGNETWSGSYPGGASAGSFVGEARPDPVIALNENTNEVFLFGKSSLQVFGPDPTFVYGTVATRERGTCAPYSVLKVDQVFAWLDQEKQFVIGDGRTTKVISEPIQQTLDEIETWSDCFGYRVAIGPVDCLVWHFPTEGRSFAYQVGGGWSQWSGWSGGNWAALSITSACLDPDGGRVLVGTSDGRLGVMELDQQTDFDEPVVAMVESGHLDRGTMNRKHCKAVRFKFRRGQHTENESVLVSWRDDLGEWSEPLECELGDTGDTAPELVFRSLGVYRSRQWRLQFSGAGQLALVSAEEEFEVLEA
jgi:hypothetical protein